MGDLHDTPLRSSGAPCFVLAGIYVHECAAALPGGEWRTQHLSFQLLGPFYPQIDAAGRTQTHTCLFLINCPFLDPKRPDFHFPGTGMDQAYELLQRDDTRRARFLSAAGFPSMPSEF